jgi:hypothetical protein
MHEDRESAKGFTLCDGLFGHLSLAADRQVPKSEAVRQQAAGR